jgi:nucleoside-diphosphate-sugar epimerase
VIHCAFNHAFSGLDMMGMIAVRLSGIAGFARISPAARLDLNAIEALLDGIAASTSPTKALVSTSGIACIAPGRVGTEDLPASPRASAAWRVASERLALSGPSSGVRTAVVRLPPSVHGVGDKGFVRMYVDLARKKGVSAWVGAGEGRWSAVHRDDAAALYCLAVEGLANGAVPGGTVLHGVADEGIPFRDIATTIGERSASGRPRQLRAATSRCSCAWSRRRTRRRLRTSRGSSQAGAQRAPASSTTYAAARTEALPQARVTAAPVSRVRASPTRQIGSPLGDNGSP